MKYNLLIDWEDQTSESGITEPVTLAEVKNYLRIEGFIDSTESISSEFDDDDALIEELITSARERLEEFTGLSFIPKTYQIEFTNLAGGFIIPFGPVVEIHALNFAGESESTSQLEYTLTSNKSKLKWPRYEELVMRYDCGYITLPKGLKEALYKEIAYRYNNRGDINVDGISKEALALASKYKTAEWLG